MASHLLFAVGVLGALAAVATAAGGGGTIYVSAPNLSEYAGYDLVELCSDTCIDVKSSSNAAECEDGGPYNGTTFPGTDCRLGTDCTACGPGVYATFSTLEEAVRSFTSADGVFEGSLFIEDTALTSLDGMQAVERVNGTLGIRYNALLEDISALQSLEIVDGALYVENNLLSSTLDGLGSLTYVGASFKVENNSALEIIDNMSLSRVGAKLVVYSHTALESIDFDALTSVGGDITITDNPNLLSLSVNALETAGFDVQDSNVDLLVEFNTKLEMASFSSLRQVEGYVQIAHNYHLTEIDLNQLETCEVFSVFRNDQSAVTGYNSLQHVRYFFELQANPLISIDDAYNSLETVGGGVFVNNDDWYQDDLYNGHANPPLESFTNSFRSLTRIGGQLEINITDASGLSGTLGSLESVGDCCTLDPPSLLEKLPACAGKLC